MSKTKRLGISLALLGWLAWRTDWTQVRHAFAGLRWELWLAAVGLYLVTQVVSGIRWQLLSEPLGFRQPLGNYIGFTYIGMYFNLFLPTSVGGDVVRAWYLAHHSARRRVDALLSVFADRLSGLVLLLGLACGGAFFAPSTLPVWVTWSVWACTAAFAAGMVCAPLAASWTRRFERVGRLAERVGRLAEGIGVYFHRPGLVLATAGLALLVQAANVVLVWLVGLALGVPVPGAYYWILVPMVTLLTLVPISLNGMGIREGGTVLFLAPLGVSDGMALSLAFLWFAVFSAAALCGGAVYLFGRFPRPEVDTTHEAIPGYSDQGRAGQPRAAA